MSDDALKSDLLPFFNQNGIKLTSSIKIYFLIKSILFPDIAEFVEPISDKVYTKLFNILVNTIITDVFILTCVF